MVAEVLRVMCDKSKHWTMAREIREKRNVIRSLLFQIYVAREFG